MNNVQRFGWFMVGFDAAWMILRTIDSGFDLSLGFMLIGAVLLLSVLVYTGR